MGKITTLHYDVECVNNNNYIVYLQNINNLPEEIYCEISSTAITLPTIATQTRNAVVPAEAICEKIKQLFDANWNLETLGIPAIQFNFNNCKRIANIFKHHPVLIFTTGTETRGKAVTIWNDCIKMLPKFTFLGGNTGKSFELVTQDLNFVLAWLQRYSGDIGLNRGLKYDFNHLLTNWYRNSTLLEELRKDSSNVIATFVVKTNLNKYIPEYLIVPIYNLKRYRKAVSILSEKYKGSFIMSLQIPCKDYAVLFPIPE